VVSNPDLPGQIIPQCAEVRQRTDADTESPVLKLGRMPVRTRPAEVRIRNYTGPLYEWRYVQLVDTVQLSTIIPGSGTGVCALYVYGAGGKVRDFDNSGGVSICRRDRYYGGISTEGIRRR